MSTGENIEEIVGAVGDSLPSEGVFGPDEDDKKSAAMAGVHLSHAAAFLDEISKRGVERRGQIVPALGDAKRVIESLEVWAETSSGDEALAHKNSWGSEILAAATEAARDARSGVDLANWELGALGIIGGMAWANSATSVNDYTVSSVAKGMAEAVGLKWTTLRERMDTFLYYLPFMDEVTALLKADPTGQLSWSHFNRARRLRDKAQESIALVSDALSNTWSVRAMEQNAANATAVASTAEDDLLAALNDIFYRITKLPSNAVGNWITSGDPKLDGELDALLKEQRIAIGKTWKKMSEWAAALAATRAKQATP